MIFYENLNKTNSEFYDEYINSLKKFKDKGSYILGGNLINFEKNFSKYIGARYCAGVANGLDALIISLKSLNLPKNSEVIVAANAYIATILAILNAGLKPILVEPCKDTYNIDPIKIEKKITKKTKAIISVHLYGKCCDMTAIGKICKKNNLFLIEDCAQSHGATFKNKSAGTFGNFACFSFYPTKLLGCLGDGGAVISKNKKDDLLIKKYRNYGSIKRYKNEIIGMNSRLDEIQAIFLIKKLKYLNKMIAHKRKLASIYFENLNKEFILPQIHNDYSDVFYVFNIRHEKRDRLRFFLKKNDVFTDIHYPTPPYKQQAVKEIFENQKLPISDEIHNTTLSLPISYSHSKEEIYKVVKLINSF